MKLSLMPKNYKAYLKLQVGRAESKWGRKGIYQNDFIIRFHEDWKEIKNQIKPEKIICMGCRDGTELFEFRMSCRGSSVVGVDITENIKTIRVSKMEGVSVKVCDFSDLPDEWENHFDLVYSNSLDHAYDPYQTVKEWHRVCKGHLFIQLATANVPNQIEHCFEAKDIPELFPSDLFEVLKVWESDTLNVFAKVIK